MPEPRARREAGAGRRTVLHAFSTFEIGGPQVRFARMANAFGPRFRHVVTAMDNRFDARQLVADDVPVEYVELPIRKGRGIANVALLRKSIVAVAPDLLATYNWGSFEWTVANAAARVPQLHVEEGFGPEETAARLPRRSLARRVGLALAPARLVVVSQTMRTIAEREWGVRADRLVYVPNGVALDAYPTMQARGRPSRFASDGGFVVGSVAGLRREKRVDRLLEAVATLRAEGVPVRAVLVGDGPERAGLAAFAHGAGLGDAVEFVGFVADPKPLYAEFDLFALTSDTEQMPVSLLEAMAAGLPVVATDVGDVRTILGEPGAEQVVGPHAAEVASAIRRLAGMPGARRLAIGQRNRDEALRRFSIESMLAAWEALFAGGLPPASAGVS